MKFDIRGNPDYGHVDFQLDPGETVLVESGAMAYMSSHMELNSRCMGGLLQALLRKILTSESLMAGEYTPNGSAGELSISPSWPGTVLHRQLDGSKPLILQPGAFLACTPGIELTTMFGGLRAIFSGEGLFFLNCAGKGDLFFNAYGAIIEKDIDGTFIVDTGHVVGWEPGLEWTIRGMGNLFSTIFSGEGLVIEFKGKGKLLLQTRCESGLVSWLSGYCRG